MRFVWDPTKAASTVQRHRVTIDTCDPEHSDGEARFYRLDLSKRVSQNIVCCSLSMRNRKQERSELSQPDELKENTNDSMSNTTRPQEVVVEVSEEDVHADMMRGLGEDEILPAGQHVFQRAGFLAHRRVSAEQAPAPGQQRVTLNLDSDIITFFQKRAARRDAISYQAQINDALREAMTRAHA